MYAESSSADNSNYQNWETPQQAPVIDLLGKSEKWTHVIGDNTTQAYPSL